MGISPDENLISYVHVAYSLEVSSQTNNYALKFYKMQTYYMQHSCFEALRNNKRNQYKKAFAITFKIIIIRFN
jgi:hypothetical protein